MQNTGYMKSSFVGCFRLQIPPSCPIHLQLVGTGRSQKRHTEKSPQYLLVWVCFFYHFLVSPQVMYHGGCILFARHSFTASTPILSPIPHKSPCAFVRVSALRLAFDRSCLCLLFLTFPLFLPRSHPVSFGSRMPL